MKKRFFGIVLTMIMVLSATSMSFAGVTVSSQATVNTEDGSYVLTANAVSAEGSQIGYQWYECDENGNGTVTINNANQAQFTPVRFNGVKYYICSVTALKADGTYDTQYSNVIKVEDNSDDGKDVEVFDFVANDIEEPVAGAVPDTDAVTDQLGYTIKSVEWLPAGDKFKAETVYTVVVTVLLDDNAKAGAGFACYINEKEATISGDYSTGEFSFNYTFQATGQYSDEDASKAEKEDMNFVEKIMDDLNIDVADIPTPFGIPYWAWGVLILLIIISIFFVIASKRRAKKERMYEEQPNHVAEIYKSKLEELGEEDPYKDDEEDKSKDKNKVEPQAEETADENKEEASEEPAQQNEENSEDETDKE